MSETDTNTYLVTRKGLLAALRTCVAVYVNPRFGLGSYWVKIAKAEAKWYIENSIEGDTTPGDMEMPCSHFGHLSAQNCLYIG